MFLCLQIGVPVFTRLFLSHQKGWMQSCLDAKVSFLKMSIEGLTNPPGQVGSQGQISCHCLLHVLNSDCSMCCIFIFSHSFYSGCSALPFYLSKSFPSQNITSSRSFAQKKTLLDHLILSGKQISILAKLTQGQAAKETTLKCLDIVKDTYD